MGGGNRKRKWEIPDDYNCNIIVRAGSTKVTLKK